MFHGKKDHAAREQAAEYATRKDFERIFTQEMQGLHLLAFLLTADREKADQCFVAGLEESVRGNAVFKQWARSWSKRAIIKNAIKMISPRPGRRAHAGNAAAGAWSGGLTRNILIAAITSLEPFDRFVLVMTVLEGYSDQECAVLLGSSTRHVTAAKSRALEQLGSLPAGAQAARSGAAVSWETFLPSSQSA